MKARRLLPWDWMIHGYTVFAFTSCQKFESFRNRKLFFFQLQYDALNNYAIPCHSGTFDATGHSHMLTEIAINHIKNANFKLKF